MKHLVTFLCVFTWVSLFDLDQIIFAEHVTISYARSGGPGGQNVNKGMWIHITSHLFYSCFATLLFCYWERTNCVILFHFIFFRCNLFLNNSFVHISQKIAQICPSKIWKKPQFPLKLGRHLWSFMNIPGNDVDDYSPSFGGIWGSFFLYFKE